MNYLYRIQVRLGDFWWYSLLIFIACRTGDAIQAFIGLWLVPRYVPQSELGAALPLLQMAGTIGLPLAIFVIPFSRWLTIYATQGEYGKIKRLIQMAFYGSIISCAVVFFVVRYTFPVFFESLRIPEGSLGILLICAGLATPLSSVFSNALQGLKRFKALSVVTALSAPVRLVVMLVAMPFRALSGYLLGQLAAPATTIGVSWFALRKEIGRGVTTVPLGRADMYAMLRYSVPVAVNMILLTLFATWQMLLIRQKLTEFDSAAFYMISRLADVATYVGLSLVTVMFPFVAEAHTRGEESGLLLKRLLVGSFIPGFCTTLIYVVLGRQLLSLIPLWSTYATRWQLLVLYTLRQTLSITASAFFSYEMSAGRFTYLWYYIPHLLFETGGLVVCTGYGAFRELIPGYAIEWLESLHVDSLGFFVHWFLFFSSILALLVGGHVFFRWRYACWKGKKGVALST